MCVKNSNKKFYIYHKIPTKKNKKKKNTSQKWMKWDLFICYMYVRMWVFFIYVHMYVCDIFVILYYLFIVDLCDYVYVYENVSLHVFLGF